MSKPNNFSSYFSNSYVEARTRFLQETRELSQKYAKAELISFKVDSRKDNMLYTDFLLIPAQKNPKNLLVLISGVHGAEGYTGSAIQSMFLQNFLQKLNLEETGVFIAHSMNPYGYKYHRRATESNVNLNRNFANELSLFATKNPYYLKFHNILTAEGKVSHPRWSFYLRCCKTLFHLITKKYKISEMNIAVAQGQFEYPQGLEYGGQAPEPQIKKFIELYSEMAKDYQNLIQTDLHTGLGKKYDLHLIPADPGNSLNPTLKEKLLDPEKEDKEIYIYTPSDTEGFYYTHGDSNSLVGSIAKESQKAIGLTLEYGTNGDKTLEKLELVHYLILENQGFHYGYKSEKLYKDFQKKYVELFCPSEDDWKENTVAKAYNFYENLITRMQQL